MHPVGVVRNAATEPREMPRGGVPSEVHVRPDYAEAIDGIDRATHIIVLAWLHRADRATLRVRPGRSAEARERGVFGSRSPDRPNPIGLATVPLLERIDLRLRVGPLDFVDGTPVVDLKPYSTGFDGAFAARGIHDLAARLAPPAVELPRLVHQAELFHGERCAGVVTAARLLYDMRERWGIAEKDATLRLTVGDDGCLADALQALTGARFGDDRLRCANDGRFRLSAGEAGSIAFRRRRLLSAEAALAAPLDELLELEEA